MRPCDRHLSPLAAASLACLLAACGGGGGDDAPAEPPATTTVVLAGVVSTRTGAPADTRPVTTRCAIGNGNATSNTDGTYQLTLSAAQLPCVLEATLADNTVLHSVAPGGGSSNVTAHINPATELVVAQLAGGNTTTYYASFDATAAAAATPARISAAATATTPVLASAGIDTNAMGPVLAGTVSTAYTGGLATLNTALTTNGQTLEVFSEAVAPDRPTARRPARSRPCRPSCCCARRPRRVRRWPRGPTATSTSHRRLPPLKPHRSR